MDESSSSEQEDLFPFNDDERQANEEDEEYTMDDETIHAHAPVAEGLHSTPWGSALSFVKSKIDLIRIPPRLFWGQALLTLMACFAFDLGHKRLSSFIRNLLWIAVLGIVIYNNDRVIRGYEEKITCVYNVQQDVTLEIVNSFSTDYSRHFTHFIKTLQEQNWTQVMKDCLSDVELASLKLEDVVTDASAEFTALVDELKRVRRQAGDVQRALNALYDFAEATKDAIKKVQNGVKSLPDPGGLLDKVDDALDDIKSVINDIADVASDVAIIVAPGIEVDWDQAKILALLEGPSPSPRDLIEDLLEEAGRVSLEYSADSAWANATIDFEPLTTHLELAKAEWESIQVTLKTIRRYLYIITALSTMWMIVRNVRLVFFTKQRPSSRASVRGIGRLISVMLRQSIVNMGVIVFTIALLVISKGMYDTSNVTFGAPQPDISFTAGMEGYVQYSHEGDDPFGPLLSAWEDAVPSYSTYLDLSTRDCQIDIGPYDWNGIDVVVGLAIVYMALPWIGIFVEPIQRLVFALPIFWLADKQHFISRGSFDRCFKPPKRSLDVEMSDTWMSDFVSMVEKEVSRRRLSPQDIETLSSKVAIVLAHLQSAADYENARGATFEGAAGRYAAARNDMSGIPGERGFFTQSTAARPKLALSTMVKSAQTVAGGLAEQLSSADLTDFLPQPIRESIRRSGSRARGEHDPDTVSLMQTHPSSGESRRMDRSTTKVDRSKPGRARRERRRARAQRRMARKSPARATTSHEKPKARDTTLRHTTFSIPPTTRDEEKKTVKEQGDVTRKRATSAAPKPTASKKDDGDDDDHQ